MFHEIMDTHFQKIAHWNRFRAIDIFLVIINLKLKGVSDFATYLILHDMYSIK